VGDRAGQIGFGTGKARTVPDAIRKATERARKDMRRINMYKGTIPHAVEGRVGGAIVILKPASPGTGIIAGSSIKVVLEVAGVRDILSKSFGSRNKINLAWAAIDGLKKLKSVEAVAKLRGKTVEEILDW
jgi:small subunit ribosomal protein S5